MYRYLKMMLQMSLYNVASHSHVLGLRYYYRLGTTKDDHRDVELLRGAN